MKIIEAIHAIDTLKPNNYTQSDKVRWLSQLDGLIKKEIIDTHEGAEEVLFEGYTENTSTETELLVPAPYDRIYVLWLQSQIDYANEEMAKYNNSSAAYNQAYRDFQNYYNRTHLPLSMKRTYF